MHVANVVRLQRRLHPAAQPAPLHIVTLLG